MYICEFLRYIIHLLCVFENLGNISTSFGLDDIRRHANDQDSVLSWIREWEAQNPVQFYKLQG